MDQSGLLARGIRGNRQLTARFTLSHPLLMSSLLSLLTLCLIFIGSRFANPALHLTVGGDDDTRVLVGFHAVEQNDSEKYRWSQPVSGVFLYGFDGRPARVDLRLIAPRPTGTPPATLTLAVGTHNLGEFVLAPGWRRYQVLVPTHPAGDTALVLRSSPYPPGGPDPRELGVAFTRVDAWPVGGAGALPPLQRILFLLSLPLLVWLLLWWCGVSIPIAASVGLLLAAGAGWAAADPLTAGYLLPTIWWPWWPFAPVLGLVIAPAALHRLRGRVPAAPWSGPAVIFAAVVALRLGIPASIGIPFLLIGTLLAVAGLANQMATTHAHSQQLGMRVEAALLVAITFLALGLRLYHLDTLPLGIWRDEARHAGLALRIWNDPTFRPVYVVTGADLPALLFYLMAPVVGSFGPHVWSARLVSALAGAFTPLALWWAARPLVGVRPALIGAALLAWSSWSLSMSRWAFPATLDHLLMLTALGLMWRVLPVKEPANTNRRMVQTVLLLSLAAACAGLAAYTYHTGRMGPITLAVLTAVRLGPVRANWRRAVPALIAAALVGLLLLAPLLHFIASDWKGYNQRVAAVSVFDTNNIEVHTPIGLLLRNAEKYLLMWHVRGDPNGRHHAPGAPMLDPLTGTLLLVGLGLAIVRWRQPELRALLLLAALNMVPGLFSGSAPHAMRSLGLLAPACMLAGYGLAAQRTENQAPSTKHNLLPLAYSLFLAGSLAFNVWLYFGAMPRNPAVYNEFYVTETAMARVARAPQETNDPALRSVKVFLLKPSLETDALRYLTSDLAVESVDGEQLSAPPGAAALLLLPASTSPEVRDAALRAFGPGAQLIADVPTFPQGERPLFLAYGIGDDAARLLHWSFTR